MDDMKYNLSAEELLKQEHFELKKLKDETCKKREYLYVLENEIDYKLKIIKELLDLYKDKNYQKTSSEFEECLQSVDNDTTKNDTEID